MPDIYIFRHNLLGRLVDQNSVSKMTIVDLKDEHHDILKHQKFKHYIYTQDNRW
jgi:hypothetical protein